MMVQGSKWLRPRSRVRAVEPMVLTHPSGATNGDEDLVLFELVDDAAGRVMKLQLTAEDARAFAGQLVRAANMAEA